MEPRLSADRTDDAIIDAATNAGFRIAVPCVRCGSWLVAAESVRLRMGKRCRAKVTSREAA